MDAREQPLHCHHEKTIVVDDRVAFVGGVDLISQAGDLFDTGEHSPRVGIGWHDRSAPRLIYIENQFLWPMLGPINSIVVGG
jgi:Phospholipase D Active site motif